MTDQKTKKKTTRAHGPMELPRARQPIELLSDRVVELEWSLTALQQAVSSDRATQPNLDPFVKQLNDLTANVVAIASYLKHSAGYRLRDTFECDSCHSRGHAAVRISCTVCNQQSWHGWFPTEVDSN